MKLAIKMMLKRLIMAALVLAVAGMLGLCVFVYMLSSTPQMRLWRFVFGSYATTTDLTPVVFEMADKRFKIPRNYLWDKEDWQGGQCNNLGFHALLPNFDGYTEANRAEFDKPGWYRQIRIMLSVHNMPTGNYHALMTRRAIYQRIIHPGTKPHKIKNLPAPYGLSQQQLLPRYPGDKQDDELYVAKKANGDFYWVECSPDKAVPFPSCSTHLEYSTHISIRYSFAKSRLADWHRIDNDVIKTIRHFEVKAPLKE